MNNTDISVSAITADSRIAKHRCDGIFHCAPKTFGAAVLLRCVRRGKTADDAFGIAPLRKITGFINGVGIGLYCTYLGSGVGAEHFA